MVEPIIRCESSYKFFSVRGNQTRIEYLETLQERVDFYALSDLYDRVEVQNAEVSMGQKIQERHGDRLKELESMIS